MERVTQTDSRGVQMDGCKLQPAIYRQSVCWATIQPLRQYWRPNCWLEVWDITEKFLHFSRFRHFVFLKIRVHTFEFQRVRTSKRFHQDLIFTPTSENCHHRMLSPSEIANSKMSATVENHSICNPLFWANIVFIVTTYPSLWFPDSWLILKKHLKCRRTKD